MPKTAFVKAYRLFQGETSCENAQPSITWHAAYGHLCREVRGSVAGPHFVSERPPASNFCAVTFHSVPFRCFRRVGTPLRTRLLARRLRDLGHRIFTPTPQKEMMMGKHCPYQQERFVAMPRTSHLERRSMRLIPRRVQFGEGQGVSGQCRALYQARREGHPLNVYQIVSFCPIWDLPTDSRRTRPGTRY